MVVLGGAADSYERGIPVPDPGKPVPDSANGGFAMVFSCPGFVSQRGCRGFGFGFRV